jgi:hypothetical protein
MKFISDNLVEVGKEGQKKKSLSPLKVIVYEDY